MHSVGMLLIRALCYGASLQDAWHRVSLFYRALIPDGMKTARANAQARAGRVTHIRQDFFVMQSDSEASVKTRCGTVQIAAAPSGGDFQFFTTLSFRSETTFDGAKRSQ